MKKIIAARITQMPRPMPEGRCDPMPTVSVILEGEEQVRFLFSFYPDEIMFLEEEIVGMTIAQVYQLRRSPLALLSYRFARTA